MSDFKKEPKPPKGFLYKTDGNGNTHLVDDPEYLDDYGNIKKVRHKPTNVFPKKKKRKK